MLAACDAALKIVADHPEAHALRIAALLDLKRYDEVLSSCEAYLARGKPTVGILEVRGLARVARKNYAAAIGDFSRPSSSAPEPEPATRTQAVNQRGWAYQFADAPRLALADFEKSLGLAPDQCDALGGRGLARIRLGLVATRDAGRRSRGPASPGRRPATTDEDRDTQLPGLLQRRPHLRPGRRVRRRTSAARANEPWSFTAVTAPAPSSLLKEALELVPDRPGREEILADPA